MRWCLGFVVLGFLRIASACSAAGMTISDAKMLPDSSPVSLSAKAITYAGANLFYVEEDSRCSGIRIAKQAHGLTVGMRADIAGTINTSTTGERYILASGAAQTVGASSSGVIAPLGMNNSTLGGADWLVVGTGGQKGVAANTDLNNIGLLVKTWGRYQPIDTSTFSVDDGSGLNIRSIAPPGTLLYTEWDSVSVTGISSMIAEGSVYRPLILVREIQATSQVEVISVPGAPTGALSPVVNVSETYSTTGSTCSHGHPIEYSFDWQEGSPSSWSTSTSASHTSTTPGTRTITVSARCKIHPTLSATSAGVNVSARRDTIQITSANGWMIAPEGVWLYDGGGGVCGNGSAFTNPNAFDGVQCAVLQGTASIVQSANFQSAGTYTLSFYSTQPASSGTQSFDVLLDGAVVGMFTPPADNVWHAYTTNTFTVAAGSHTLIFKGYNLDGKPAFLDALSVALSPSAIVNPSFEIPVVGAGNFLYGPGGGYRYGPSSIINSDGSIDMWMASPGADGEWDWIRYRHSTDGGHTWTPDQIVLKPTPGSVDAYSVCDPGVIRFGGYYYIGYTSTANASGVENHVYIARSTSATGPWDKWNGTGWGSNPQPLLKYTGATGFWGCGEPSFVLKDGKLYIYYTWNDAGGYTDLAICDNPSADNWPANLTLYGHVIPRISGEDSTDVKYVDALSRFVGISTCDRMGNNATISVLQSADGISWERAPFRGTLAQCGTHNAGISGTETGHLDLSMNNFIAYAYQPPGGSWGNWPTHVDPISLTTVGVGSAVHANVTSILNDEYYTNAPRLDDGNLSTSWSSAAHTEPSAAEWAGIDLGMSNTIRGLRITPGASCFPASFALQYSHDGSTWYTIARQSYTGYSDPDGKPRIFQFFPAVTARYFRLNATNLTSDGSNYYLKLSEMETVINPYTDTTAPTGSITINSGDEGCYSRNVTLTLSATDTGDSGLWQMRFSNDNSIWSPWQAYATTANWTLATGDGVKTVTVQYVDQACNTSTSNSDTIALTEDNTAPLAGASTPPASVTTDTIAVPYSGASDNQSGLKQVELWFKKEAAGVWTNSGVTSATGSGTFDFTPANGSGRYYFDLVAEDNAGNRSAAATGNGDGLTIFKLLWSDGFESNNFTAGGWTNSGCTLQTAYKNTGAYAVQFNSSDILTKSFSTVGRTNITVEYARYTRAMETDDHFICDWSIDGTTWNTLEDLTGNSAWTAKAFSLPVAAENQSGFRIRFRTTHNTSTDYAYLDDVRIIGL